MAGKSAKKFYAVKSGRKPGIYTSWDECKEQVLKFPSAVYKSFPTLEQAQEYMNMETGSKPVTPETRKNELINSEIEEKILSLGKEEAVAFCDGSYSNTKKRCGYGVILFTISGKEEFMKSFSDPEIVQSRNFSAEMFGSLKAAEACLDKGIKKLTLYYDYQGIEAFACGLWTPSHTIAKLYTDQMKMIMQKLRIDFVKVPAHQNILWNERADQLAKESLNLK